eukprot:TRINITY_DN2667_c0_g1_i15.p1 TRINITY_DN2667_c0_g1~~TRINITY_DN2667_c0_g1_i15.p1  ORF type:complete len:333 (+),score=76.44 TRINITY_DN2667_c0_g1_i15:124-999(+)
MENDMYDEFGNYIGPEIERVPEEAKSSGAGELMEDFNELQRGARDFPPEEAAPSDPRIETISNEIVLQEDKRYYPDLEEVYPGAEVLVMEEDIQPLSEPIIAPIKTKDFDIVDKVHRQVMAYDYLEGFFQNPDLIRNVAVLGQLHHGKSSLIDTFLSYTHGISFDNKNERRFTDSRKDERERELSIKAKPVSLVLQDSREKSYLVNIMDTPGHPNFFDEVVAALRVCDGALVVVDAVEGVMQGTERLIKQALTEGLSIVIVINKIDRLVVELRLPPNDAYHKIRHMLCLQT